LFLVLGNWPLFECLPSSDADKVVATITLGRRSRMKSALALVFTAAVAASVTGCVVQSTYSKSVAVTKDATGRVVQTVETETVVQPGQGYPIRLEKIAGVQP
jgi:hypothetical protein